MKFLKRVASLVSNKRERVTNSSRKTKQVQLKITQIKYFLRINSCPKISWFQICITLKKETVLSFFRIISLLAASPIFIIEDNDFNHVSSLKIKLIKLNCDVDILQSTLINVLSQENNKTI